MKYWCSKGKHWVEKSGFSKCRIKQPSRWCRECESKQKKDYWLRKKSVSDPYSKMFFDYTGI